MPLFTMPKKAEIKQEESKSNKILDEEIKIKNNVNLRVIEEDYAILGCNKLKFYYILYLKDSNRPINNVVYSYLPDNDILENRILCEMYALKLLGDNLRRLNIKSIKVYCSFKWQDIEEYSKIRDMSSMFRYKAREIIKLIEEYPLIFYFNNITPEIKEVIDNENQL